MTTTDLHRQHERSFADNRFVYPVLSRRSGGISIGVNLNPDKICNFGCIYCQVNRTVDSETRFVDMEGLYRELDAMLRWAVSGRLFDTEKFRACPADQRRLNDIAFSGDGEPTTYRNFDQIVTQCAQLKRDHGLDHVKMVLITNASMFHRPHVQRGLEVLDANQGEIWAKLEAGTEQYYQTVERTSIPFSRVLENITEAACRRPLVIQSLFMRIHGQPPSRDELRAYCDRLVEITSAGGQLSLVQVYTVARQPAESYVKPLTNRQVDAIVDLVRERTGLAAAGFYGGE
jgi:wyosine [tRNA(Phe)-imidazoG37] synthetase (radical SAM superfamily)